MENKRSLVLDGRLFSIVNDLPLIAKLLLVVLVPIIVILGVILPLTVNGLDQMEANTNIARLEDEVRVIGQQFAQVEANLINEASNLTSNPALLDAVERRDEAALNPILINRRLARLEHVYAGVIYVNVDHLMPNLGEAEAGHKPKRGRP